MKKFYCLLYSLSLIFLSSSFAFAEDSATIVAKANKLYKAKKYDEALALYHEALKAEPDSAAVNFNIGTAHFKKKNYASAVSSFEMAAVSSDKALEAKANYNIGNARYKLGKQKEAENLSHTVKLLQEALDYYKRAIELNPKGKEPKINHELVEKELKTLLNKLKQQKDEKSKSQKQEGKEGESQEKKEETGAEKPQETQPAEKQQQDGGQKEEKTAQAEKEQKAVSPQDEELKDTQTENKAYTPEEAKEMSDKEARMLLEGYRYEEEAKGKINDAQKGYSGEVEKDW